MAEKEENKKNVKKGKKEENDALKNDKILKEKNVERLEESSN